MDKVQTITVRKIKLPTSEAVIKLTRASKPKLNTSYKKILAALDLYCDIKDHQSVAITKQLNVIKDLLNTWLTSSSRKKVKKGDGAKADAFRGILMTIIQREVVIAVGKQCNDKIKGLTKYSINEPDFLLTESLKAFKTFIADYMKQDAYKKNQNIAFAFRLNGPATKLMGACLFGYGKEKYFTLKIAPKLKGILGLRESLEIQPGKLGHKKKNEAENIKKIKKFYDALMLVFTESGAVNAVPIQIRNACRQLYAQTKKQGAAEKGIFDLISSTLILRFLNPCILTLGIKAKSPHSKRVFMLLNKILQNQANGVLFGKKEQYMIPFNPLLNKHQPKVEIFIKKVAGIK